MDEDDNSRENSLENNEDESLGVFINPRTDFGFKKVFNNARMMMSFLNAVISPRIRREKFQVTSLTYLPVEHWGENESERRVIVDSRCRTSSGEDIVVEMQNARPVNFAERLIYYISYLIRYQMPKIKHRGKKDEKTPAWHYKLQPIYLIAIVNFPMIKGKTSKNVVIDWIRLMSMQTKRVFSKKLNFVIVDLSKFNKKKEELKTAEDIWLFTLKYADTLKECPAEIKDELFIDLYENILQTNKLIEEKMEAYSALEYKQMGLFTDYAREEGRKEGLEESRKEGIEIGRKEGRMEVQIQVVRNCYAEDMSIKRIAQLTGLTEEEISSILTN
ncbi:MAG: Rpn family recombination-promoting nuclease/putative transposase [Prevotellaceae bacterium]|jgi:predicted transposase/invertase (TIGR01784 family)|nr:Rpn family recombination-promoting nuclease/putative transposase [Prevotellaceae bacterium]